MINSHHPHYDRHAHNDLPPHRFHPHPPELNHGMKKVTTGYFWIYTAFPFSLSLSLVYTNSSTPLLHYLTASCMHRAFAFVFKSPGKHRAQQVSPPSESHEHSPVKYPSIHIYTFRIRVNPTTLNAKYCKLVPRGYEFTSTVCTYYAT